MHELLRVSEHKSELRRAQGSSGASFALKTWEFHVNNMYMMMCMYNFE